MTEPKKVAILFYGLTRSLRNIYDNFKQNILDELTSHGYEYNIFIHTFILQNPYVNPWSGETVAHYDNLAYQILNPIDFILEYQNDVEQKLRIPQQYFSKLGDWAGCATTPHMKGYLVRNMVLALYSKRKVVELFKKHHDKNKYDYVIITRPDQIFHTKLNVNSFQLLHKQKKNIIIPREHGYHGVNDRFCIATPFNAIQYGRAFYKLKKYSQQKSIISEVYMMDYLNALGFNIIYSPLKTQLVRC
jgi:hypothetical protein